MADITNDPFVGVFIPRLVCLVKMKFIRAFCSWEPTQWHNMKWLVFFRDRNTWNEIYENLFWQNENFSWRENSRAWFMWIWIKREWSFVWRGGHESGQGPGSGDYASCVWKRWFSWNFFNLFAVIFDENPKEDIC